jgi:hypothetical protein
MWTVQRVSAVFLALVLYWLDRAVGFEQGFAALSAVVYMLWVMLP